MAAKITSTCLLYVFRRNSANSLDLQVQIDISKSLGLVRPQMCALEMTDSTLSSNSKHSKPLELLPSPLTDATATFL